MSIKVVNLVNETVPIASLGYTLAPFETKIFPYTSIPADLQALDAAWRVQVDFMEDSAPVQILGGTGGRNVLANGSGYQLSGHRKLTNLAMYRYRSAPNTTGSALNWTTGIKLETERHYDGLAVVICNCITAIMKGVKAVVAASETFSQSTQDTRYRPVVGGVTYNTLRGGTDAYGWDQCTFSSGASSTVDVPASSGGTDDLKLQNSTSVISDVMPISSVDRADGSSLPIAMARINYDPTVVDGRGNWPFIAVVGEYTTSSGRKIDIGTSGADCIGTAGSLLGSNMASSSAAMMWAYIVARHTSGVCTVAGMGDSHKEQSGILSPAGEDLSSNYVLRACHDLSTRKRPVVPANLGLSSRNSASYTAHGKTVMEVIRPTILLYQIFSVNDAQTSQRKVQDRLQEAMALIKWCQDRDIFVILESPTLDQRPAYNTAPMHAARMWLTSRVLDLADSAGCGFADYTGLFTLVSGVDNYKSGYKSSVDDFHMSVQGMKEIMYPQAKLAIQRAMAYLGI